MTDSQLIERLSSVLNALKLADLDGTGAILSRERPKLEEVIGVLRKRVERNRERVKKWREENPDKVKEHSNRAAAKLNGDPEAKERKRLYNKERYLNNTEEILAKNREWKIKNRERVREYHKKRYWRKKKGVRE